MQNMTVVIPALHEPWDIVDRKLLRLADAWRARLNVIVHAESPALKRRYFFGTNAPFDTRERFEQSVKAWCDELCLRLDEAGIEYEQTVEWGRHLERSLSTVTNGTGDSWLILINAQSHMTQQYRAIVRHSRVPTLVLYGKPWGARLSLVAAVDPVHEHDMPRVKDVRIVEWAKFLAGKLAGTVMIVHSCFVPAYLASYRVKIESHHRENIRDFIEENSFERLAHSVIAGDPAVTLRKYIRKNHTDVLAMGSVARGFLDRDVIGSTTENILADAPCDLLLVSDQH